MKAPKSFSVWLGHRHVGSLLAYRSDDSFFAFDEDFIRDEVRPVLSLSFLGAEGGILRHGIASHAPKLHPFFSNLLPEGQLRTLIADQAGMKQVRDLPLLELLGNDLPGAVIVRKEETGPPDRDEQMELPAGKPGNPLKFSLAGMQLKVSASGSPQSGLTIPVGGRGGHWILKVPSATYSLLPENEHSMMTLSSQAGIQTAESGLVPISEVGGLPAVVSRSRANALWVKRFDRTDDGQRIHMEDFNQVYGQQIEAKYKNYSYGNIANDLARVTSLQDVAEFVRRLVFCAAIGNADMHLKNWTLLYPGGRTPVLSPAYDLVSTIAYLDDRNMALSIRRVKDMRKLDVTLLRHFAARIPVPEKLILDTALETAERTVDTWRRLEKDLPIEKSAADAISSHMQAVPLTRQFWR